jgi:hypothetical protein
MCETKILCMGRGGEGVAVATFVKYGKFGHVLEI